MRLLLILLSFPLFVIGQNSIGLPEITNFSRQTYGAGLQNWDVKQDINGLIYIANNDGLLIFDGRYWNLYRLPNKTNARSVEISQDGKIYVGGQDELGYFKPCEAGKLRYHSLISLIPEGDRSFGDVWDIISIGSKVYFRTSSRIFTLSGNKVSVYPAPMEWAYLGLADNEIYAQDYQQGLMRFQSGYWKPVEDGNSLPHGDPVTGLLPVAKGNLKITTLKNGIFELEDRKIKPAPIANQEIFREKRIYSAVPLKNGWMALATSLNGLYVIDQEGQIIQKISRQEGLQNNNVLSVFMDNQENLWLGLDNGIDLIAYNSAIKHILPNGLESSGYAATIHGGKLFLGGSGGLFSVDLEDQQDLSFSRGDFDFVNGSSGQVWNLSEINNKLLVGHHEGAFMLVGNKLLPLKEQLGFWNFVPTAKVFPTSTIVAGNYKGLQFFNCENDKISASFEVPGFKETSRFVTIDQQGNIWVSHPYHGIYRVAMENGSYRVIEYNAANGLPSNLNNHVYNIRNEIVIATEEGIYQFNKKQNRFEPSPQYKSILGNLSIRYLREDLAGNVWFIHEKKMGVIDFSSQKPEVVMLPELDNKMLSGFEFIYPINKNNILLAAEKGFYHINYEKYRQAKPTLSVQMRTVRIIGDSDSLLFGGFFAAVNEKQVQQGSLQPSISSAFNTIRFEFSTPLFGHQENLEYAYRLKGFDSKWSSWTKRTDKEYTNLPPGNYELEIKVRDNAGRESDISTYAFEMLPPWYQTNWAYVIYLLISAAVLYGIVKWQKTKFRLQQKHHIEEQKRLQYIHELELNKTENELMGLRNEKLETEIHYKNSELASTAMHLVKKGELFAKIKTDLNQIIKELDNPQAISSLKKMLRSLNEDEHMDSEWENFAKHFDKVHSDFVVALKEKHPNISPNEIKLCTYLRMNLTSKEIAQLMNISVRGVEISRYRLRKRLGISSEVNLFDYLIEIREGEKVERV